MPSRVYKDEGFASVYVCESCETTYSYMPEDGECEEC